jgi:hypothetical protein
VSNKINIDGREYDFDRCTKEQLAAYVRDFQAGHGCSAFVSGVEVLDAARVPRERKEDVARVIAERVAFCWAESGRGTVNDAGVSFHDAMRDLAERYRKAV